MRKIKINYAGWWSVFDPKEYLIDRILRKYYDVEISKDPDYVFCSVYSDEFLKYDCIRIFYTAENIIPDFNLFDYCIGFDDISFGDRYIRIPNYVMNPKYEQDIRLLQTRQDVQAEDSFQREFCGMVVSNGNADPMRDHIVDEISKYKKVSSGGRHRNNIGLPGGVANKLEFQQRYKFALALENASYKGYTTEKLVEAFAAGGIPVYWGDPEVDRYFNEKAFINIMSFPSLEDAVKKIRLVDNDKDLYRSYLSEPAMVMPEHFEQSRNDFERFLLRIIEQPIGSARRRPTSQWIRNVEKTLEKGLSYGPSSIKFRDRIRSMIKNRSWKE